MTIQEIAAYLQGKYPEAGLTVEETKPDPTVRINVADLIRVGTTLRDDPELRFESMMSLSGVEKPTELQVVYHFHSMPLGHKFTLRVGVPKDNPVVPSLCFIWATAEWHEREANDLFGIVFSNHPDPRRILLPDDWQGHPLRKDYVAQTVWHGIPLTSSLPSERNPKPDATLPSDRAILLKQRAK